MGDYLTSGIAIVKISEPTDTIRKTKIFVGGHPLPNEEGERGCREILRLVDAAGPEDLFILLMSGGSSALMSLPVDGISLQDEIAATDIMLKSGAGILEVNAVRRHISQMNGGRLAERIVGRGSEIIGFNISDSVEGSPTDDISVPVPDMSGTPMCPDRTTLADALEMISNRNLTDRMPESILHYLETCGPAGETPKKLDRTTYYTEDEVVKMGVAVFRRLGKIITKWQNGTPAVHGGSYGWAAPSNDPAVIMDLIAAAVEDCGYTDRFAYAMDYASSEFFNPTDGTYELCGERVTHDAMIEKAKEIITKHPMVFIEDLCSEDDWEGFVKAHKVLTRTNIIGDDFLVTNIERIKKAKEMDAVDGFIFKPNQIGTVTEAFAAVDYAESQGMFFVPSGRAGGAIQDLVVDMGIGRHALLAKNGSPWSGERLDSLNTYLRASNDLREIPVADISGIVKF